VTNNTDEHNQLVQQQMQARAERHLRERQVEEEEQSRRTQAAQAAQAQAEQVRLRQADAGLRREATAEARRQRPQLRAKYKDSPAGVRHVETLREVCLACGSENTRARADLAPDVFVCWVCSAEWYAGACWSCAAGRLDSRDPETPPCERCGWTKCAVCGACNPQGCSTNPYSSSSRQRDGVAAQVTEA
jgi:hypothetical protein